MFALWTGTPTTVRLDDLDIICAVLECATSDPLSCRPRRLRRATAAWRPR
ncbi:helix-turn-helix domain-containing protein [Streptomyces sp. NRAIS4]